MSGWTEGYVADIPYALGFYRETVPAHIAFAAIGAGKHPGLGLRPGRVLELGIGMGLGFVINAASNPGTRFEGVDFNPLHVAHARGLVEEAGLENVALREASFQDLAREAAEGQHDLDLIVLHGILTWVSAEAHAAIVEIARKRLKPGGLLYVSYNAMPGWAAVLPMQRLMRENAKRVAGRSDQQVAAGLDLVKAMIEEGALYFGATPSLAKRVEAFARLDKAYLAHEYLNANWFIFHVADVAEMFGRAKLGFVGSATLIENMDTLSIPERLRARVTAETDPVFKETLRDIATNKQFRRDLFARGVSATRPLEQAELAGRSRFVLAVPRGAASLTVQSPLGELKCNPDLYAPLLDLLAEREASLSEIAALPAYRQAGAAAALQAVSLMIHSGQVLPAPAERQDPAPAQRLNRVLIRKAVTGRIYSFLAAPAAGSGVPLNHIDLLILAASAQGQGGQIDGLTDATLALMARLGSNPVKDGAPITDPAERRASVRADVERLLADKLPCWRRLGAL